jgi:hypothetical protein
MALDTVSDYVALARVLLQDAVNSPYRYSDTDLVLSLTNAFPAAKLARPDLFIVTTLQTFTANDTTPVVFDPMYRMALVYYMVGFAQLRDDEEVQDQRAAAFMSMFTAILKTGTL